MRKAISFFIIILLLLAGCTSKDDRRDALLSKSKAYETSQKFAEAKIEARNAIKLDPNSAEAYLILGRCGLKENDGRAAFQAFLRVLEIDAGNIEARLNVSELLLRSGNAEQAEQYLAPVLEKHPEMPEVKILQAGINIQNKDYASAEKLFDEILAVNQSHEEATLGLAALFTLQKEPEKARQLLRESLVRQPDSPSLLTALLNQALFEQDFASATQYINKLLALDPYNPNLVLRMADIYFKLGRIDQGQDLLEDFILVKPESELVRIRLAESYITSNRVAMALDILEKAPQSTPDIQLMQALALLQTGSFEHAVSLLEQLTKVRSNNKASLRAHIVLADVYTKQKDNNKAIQELTTLLQSNPGDLEALVRRAHLLIAQKQYTDAVADLRIVVRESPDDINSAIALANTYNASGNRQLAEESFKDILKKNPDNALTYLTLANLYLQQGRFDEAIATLRFGRSAVRGISDLHFAEAEILVREKRYVEAIGVLNDLGRTEKFHIPALLRIASIHAESGNYMDSIQAYDQVLEQVPEYLAAIEGKIRMMIAAGETGQAIQYAEKRHAARPKDPMAAALVGEAALADKDIQKAESVFLLAMELAPQWDHPTLRLVQIYAKDGNYDKGIEAAQKLLKQNSDAMAPALLMALLQEQKGDTEGAEATYRTMLLQHGYIPVVANNLANLLSLFSPTKERLEEAEKLALESVKTGAPEAHSTLGWIYHLQGRDAVAEIELRKALAVSPENNDIKYRLAVSLVSLNRKGEAKKILSSILGEPSDYHGRDLAQKLHDSL